MQQQRRLFGLSRIEYITYCPNGRADATPYSAMQPSKEKEEEEEAEDVYVRTWKLARYLLCSQQHIQKRRPASIAGAI